MDKEWYKTEIDRIARENGGKPPGERQFYNKTGTKLSNWRNKRWNEWNNWGDALEEFGYSRGKFIGPTDKIHILRLLTELTQSLNPPRVPTQTDLRRAKRQNSEFPSDGAIANRLGKRPEMIRALIEFCGGKGEYSRALELFKAAESTGEETTPLEPIGEDEPKHGYVYLLRGKEGYKVGMTTAPYSRASTLIKSLPHGGELIHHFATDDPRGIEKYWQKIRWKDKQIQRVNAKDGEWFDLNSGDVQAFKRRKNFM